MTRPLEQNPQPIYPENLLDGSDKKQLWHVAHVKSRREKALAGFLFKSGVSYYLPMVNRRQPSSKRIRYSMVPLFSGYLFFNTDEAGRYKALRSNHIARTIEVKDPDNLVMELRQIQKAISGNVQLYPMAFLSEGQWVRVKSGPMKDIEGRVIRTAKKSRLLLSVTSIMQSVSVEIDADMVEPA